MSAGYIWYLFASACPLLSNSPVACVVVVPAETFPRLRNVGPRSSPARRRVSNHFRVSTIQGRSSGLWASPNFSDCAMVSPVQCLVQVCPLNEATGNSHHLLFFVSVKRCGRNVVIISVDFLSGNTSAVSTIICRSRKFHLFQWPVKLPRQSWLYTPQSLSKSQDASLMNVN